MIAVALFLSAAAFLTAATGETLRLREVRLIRASIERQQAEIEKSLRGIRGDDQ